LVGGYSEANAAIIKKEAAALGLVVTEPRDSSVAYGDPSAGDVRLAGWVDLETLQACFRNATALLLPLFDDERSRTRMPNKLPEYLASCKPVITSKVGDLQDFLVDGVNASIAKPGDSVDFACKMTALLTDPELATRIGIAGRQTCAQNLDYRAHAACLAEFLWELPAEAGTSARGGHLTVSRTALLVRNLFCGTLAVGLIACGRVRRARRAALGYPVATALYFTSRMPSYSLHASGG